MNAIYFKLKKREEGFTLLEVLVALAIIAIAFTGIIRLQSQTISMGGAIKFYNLVPLLAQEKLADIETQANFFLEGEGSFGEELADYRWKITTDDKFLCNFEKEKEKGKDEESNVTLKKIDILIYNSRHKYQITKYKFVPQEE